MIQGAVGMTTPSPTRAFTTFGWGLCGGTTCVGRHFDRGFLLRRLITHGQAGEAEGGELEELATIYSTISGWSLGAFGLRAAVLWRALHER